jgi:phospholipase C
MREGVKMVSKSRRNFLQFSANSTAAMAGMAMLPKSIREALAMPVPRGSGTIRDVKHIVIFMQENRSFDHYFGTLKGVRGFGDPRAVTLPNGKPVWYQPNPANSFELPFHLDTSKSNGQWLDSLDHSWKKSQKIWQNFDCWVDRKGPMTMGYFKRSDIPFYYALADAFTIGDAYHSSIFGPTTPNRMHMFTGTSGLTVGNDGIQVAYNDDDGNVTSDIANDEPSYTGYTWTTYPERLQEAGISWKVYQEYDNFGDNPLAYFKNFRKINKTSLLYQRGRATVDGSNFGNAEKSNGQYLVDAFAKDILNNTLPQVSWIVAPTRFSEHPSWPPGYGESLTSRLVNELAKNKEVWSQTAFIINYDENDGFFDHMPPHIPAINRELGLSTVSTDYETYWNVPVGLGIRVPILVVSPWTKGGWLCSEVFDHTSIIRFLEKRFQVYEPNISPWRRALCGDLTSMFNFKNPDEAWLIKLPDTSSLISKTDDSRGYPHPKVPTIQELPKQEIGIRPARPLPYILHTDARMDIQGNKFWIDFANSGAAGAGFNVYTNNSNDIPRYYTVESQKKLSDFWDVSKSPNGIYEISVQGPNGFFRFFKGDMSEEVEVYARYFKGDILFYLNNLGNSTCIFKVIDNLYGGEPLTYSVAAGKSFNDIWKLSGSSNWYDFTVTVNTNDNFLRQWAGHVETGLPSTSDPAFGKI